jgi:hypothetical protein
MARLPKGYLDMGRAEYAAYNSDTLRAVYVELREIVRYTMGNGPADSAIRAQRPSAMVKVVKPVDRVMAVKSVECKCERCKGTGTYRWGACVNGRMSHSASCARCNGKGRMDFGDMRRGRAYDNHAICRAAR